MPPGGPWTRVDSHCYPGWMISPFYDSLIAKLIVWAPDRERAIDRMARALDEFEISGRGVKTTIPFHQKILQNEQFRSGDVTTDFVEQFMAEERKALRPRPDRRHEMAETQTDAATLERLLEISSHLNSTLKLDELLGEIMGAATELTGAETSSLLLVDEEGGDLTVEVATGKPGEAVERAHVPAGQGIAGWVVENGEPVMVDDPEVGRALLRRHRRAERVRDEEHARRPDDLARPDDRRDRGDQQARRIVRRARPEADDCAGERRPRSRSTTRGCTRGSRTRS